MQNGKLTGIIPVLS